MSADGRGLRARKKERSRRHIAETAARLFGERGYDNVTVTEVARAAEVSSQTVFNYFPTKPDLVLDRESEVRDRLVGLVRDRPAGTSPAEALREAARQEIALLRTRPREDTVGELPTLCATSTTVRRLALEARDRQAEMLTAAVLETDPSVHPWVARARATALVSVFQAIVDHTGRRLLEGVEPAEIADELTPLVDAALDDLVR